MLLTLQPGTHKKKQECIYRWVKSDEYNKTDMKVTNEIILNSNYILVYFIKCIIYMSWQKISVYSERYHFMLWYSKLWVPSRGI